MVVVQREGAVAKVATALRAHPRDKKVLAAALGALAALKFFHVDGPIQRHGEP
eukprot:COSAG04_NODE_3058_length_3225_cov_1.442418_2_plen_53_part_00